MRLLPTLALLFSPLLFAADVLPDKPHLYVEGHAAVVAPPDQMRITVEIARTDPDVESAKADIDQRSTRLIQALIDLGIDVADITTVNVSVTPQFQYENGKQTLIGTRASRNINIRLRNLARYGDLMATLFDARIDQLLGTEFELSNADAMKDKALAAALADARVRAENLAKAQGMKLGEVWSISQFNTRYQETAVLQPNQTIFSSKAGSEDIVVSAARSTGEPFQPGTLTGEASIYVVFLLK